MMNGTRRLLTITLLCGSAVLAQNGGSSGSNVPEYVLRGLPPPTPLPNGGDNAAGISLSGQVALEEGSAAPGGIAIEVRCSNFRRTVAQTDSKGRFTFQWGGRALSVSDASGSGHQGSGQLLGVSSGDAATALRTIITCDLRANLSGYQSDEIRLTERRASDHTDLGMIVLHRLFTVEGITVSSTFLKAPKKARNAYESGLKAMNSGRMDGAARDFERSVEEYPAFANAWLELGRVRQRLGSAATARQAWAKAIELDPKLTAPYMELGLDAGLSHDWKAAIRYLDEGLRLDPVDYPEAWFGDAVAHYYLGDYAAAEKSVREAVRLDPKGRNPRAGYVLGMILAHNGDRAGAAAELRRYLKAVPQAADAKVVEAQLAALENR